MSSAEWASWIAVLIDLGIFIILIVEYRYDERKDLEKKQRKTRTTKKVTTQPGGASTTEETTEVSEPVPGGPK